MNFNDDDREDMEWLGGLHDELIHSLYGSVGEDVPDAPVEESLGLTAPENQAAIMILEHMWIL